MLLFLYSHCETISMLQLYLWENLRPSALLISVILSLTLSKHLCFRTQLQWFRLMTAPWQLSPLMPQPPDWPVLQRGWEVPPAQKQNMILQSQCVSVNAWAGCLFFFFRARSSECSPFLKARASSSFAEGWRGQNLNIFNNICITYELNQSVITSLSLYCMQCLIVCWCLQVRQYKLTVLQPWWPVPVCIQQYRDSAHL